jgi:hypothetical protein
MMVISCAVARRVAHRSKDTIAIMVSVLAWVVC